MGCRDGNAGKLGYAAASLNLNFAGLSRMDTPNNP
jgi:hypothetical protein